MQSGRTFKPGRTYGIQAGEAQTVTDEELITSLTERLGSMGYTVRHRGNNLPHNEDILMVYKVRKYGPEVEFVDGKKVYHAHTGYTPAQREKHFEEAANYIANPQSWRDIIPETPPTLYANESADKLARYLANKPDWVSPRKFNPANDKYAILNPALRDAYSSDLGRLYEEAVATGDEELIQEAIEEILLQSALPLGSAPHSLSFVSRVKGEYKIVGGVGEPVAQEMLEREVAEELSSLIHKGEYAQLLREKLAAGKRAQEMVNALNTPTKVQVPTVAATTNDEFIALLDPTDIAPSGLPKPSASLHAANEASVDALESSKGFGVATVDLSDIAIMSYFAEGEAYGGIGETIFKEAVKRVRRIADDAGLKVGHFGGDNFKHLGGDQLILWGNIKDGGPVVDSLNKMMTDLLESAPDAAKLLYAKGSPVIITPSAGIAFGENTAMDTLLADARAMMFRKGQVLKARQWAHGFGRERGFSKPEVTKDGFLFKAKDGTEFIVPFDDSTELWTEIAYAKILREGGEIQLRDGKLAVVKGGNVVYTAENSRQLALLEMVQEPMASQDLTPFALEAFGGNVANPINIDGGMKEDSPVPAMESRVRGLGEWFTWYWRTTRSVANDVQKKYGFELGDFYDVLHKAHTKMFAHLTAEDKLIRKASKGLSSQRLQEQVESLFLLHPSERAKYLPKLGENVNRLYIRMQKLFYRAYEDMNIPKEHWDKVLWYADRYKAGALDTRIYNQPWFKMLEPLFKMPEMSRGLTDIKVETLLHKMWRAHLKARHVVPVVKEMRLRYKDLKELRGRDLPDEVDNTVNRMGELFLGAMDMDFVSMVNFFARWGKDSPAAYRVAQNLPATILALQYSHSMAFRLGLPFRNLFQPIITASPIIGLPDVLKGYATAFKVLPDENKWFRWALGKTQEKIGLDELRELGIWQDSLPVPMGQVLSDPLAASGWMGQVMRQNRWGLEGQRQTERLVRMTAFYGGIHHSTRALNEALRKNKGFEWFAKAADLNMFHKVDRARWKAMWDKATTGEGSWRELIVDFSRRVADDTQFTYASYANPRAFHHTLSKMCMQYGVWPTNYLDLIVEKGIRGEARARFWRRLITTHGTLGAAGAAAGLKMDDWTFLEPLQYTGGPITQYVAAMITASAGPREDKLNRLAAVSMRYGMQLVPVGGLWKHDIRKALEYLAREDGTAALLSMFRLADWPDDQVDITTEYE
jgi:hypothetical protein